MPRLDNIHTNFTAGEITPKMNARVDVDRYRNAAAVLQDLKIHVHGGVERRDGTRYITPAKYANKKCVLIPYIFNQDQAYMLEVGDGYFRFYTPDGQIQSGPVPLELPSPYAEADLFEIDYVQGADTMFLFNVNYPTKRLRRFGNTSWAIDDAPWTTEPFDEVGHRPNATLTLSAATVGTGRTFTASASSFLAGDVGRYIEAQGGRAIITAVTDATHATCDILTPFPATSFATLLWFIDGTPLTTITPSADSPEGATITLTASSATWRATDVDSWVSLNDGLVQITAYTSATVVSARIAKVLSATVAVPPFAWILESSVWGGAFGYPRTGTLFQQRLWMAGSPGYPQTVWGSVIGQYYDFELGVDDTDAVSFNIASDQLNPILNMTQVKTLVALTSGGEFTLIGGNEKPITPTNVQITNQSNYGCTVAAPERAANELMFVQRSGMKVRALSADKINTDQYGAPDLTVLAEHLAESGFVQLAYQGEPTPVLYALRNDGQIAACTVDRDQDVTGWTHYVTDGVIEAIACLPVAGGDQLWAVVKRTIDGGDVRYIERFETGIMTDCAITGVSEGEGADIWSGLDHLEGKTVVVKADGVVMAEQVVTGGEITIERPALAIEIGLKYTPRVEMLPPEVVSQEGTAQGSNMRVSKVICRFIETTGATVNGQTIFSRHLVPASIGTPPPIITGDEQIETLGWDLGKWSLVIEQPYPYPFHLLGVITTLTVNS